MKTLILAAFLAIPQADTLPVPHAYLAAMEQGTRTRTGEPGPNYWRQEVDYDIDVTIHPDRSLVEGSERISYTNRSPDTLTEITLNLNQNVFAPGNPRNRSVPITGGFVISRIAVQGEEGTVEPRPGRSLPTILVLDLPEALPPGGSVELELDWSFEVPEGTFRMGRDSTEVFFLAQWYPQVAVYDDLNGWVRDPYLGDGEFYVDYGDFDVRIRAPEGWLVSASGVLQNPEAVLTDVALGRLQTLSRDAVTRVVTVEDHASGAVTASSEDGFLEWHFVAENVRDFAWGTSASYVWDATLAEYPGLDGSPTTSVMHAFYRPDRENWDQAAAYARHSIESHSHWYPYPYPQMTVNEGVIGGGMEYPMITIIGGGRTPLSLYGVTSHEIAHMWWPMVVGTNEKAFAWMDEGLASFSEDLFTPDLFPEVNSGLNSMRGYLRIAGTDRETPSMRHADLYGAFGNRGLASYSKPASVFRALRAVLGPELFDEALREYTSRWAFKHPHPLDLFWTFEDVTGMDLDWYFHPWMYTTRVMDQAIVGVQVFDSGRRVRVTLEDRGEIRMPVILTIEVDGQAPVEVTTDWDRWEGRTMVLEVGLPGEILGVYLDPDQMLPDVDRSDNSWTAEGNGASGEAPDRN